MTFIWPVMLLLLLLIPFFVVVYLRWQTQRRQMLARLGSMGFTKGLTMRKIGFRRHIPIAFFIAALTLLVISMARPENVVSLPRIAGTVILAFDVSGSMAADDLKPTRMEAAKAAAREFVARQPKTVQIGVVAFSDNGLSVQPPSYDQAEVIAAINRLKPQRGTSLANGIYAALTAIELGSGKTRYYTSSNPDLTPTPAPTATPMPKGTYAPAVMVLLTDGENNIQPDPFEAAQAAIDRGVKIFTIGIGSAAGANIKIEGFTVHTQLDEATLQQIAQMTDGAYFNAESEQDLRTIYNNLTPQLIIKTERIELTSLLAGAGVALLIIGGALSLIWFGRAP